MSSTENTKEQEQRRPCRGAKNGSYVRRALPGVWPQLPSAPARSSNQVVPSTRSRLTHAWKQRRGSTKHPRHADVLFRLKIKSRADMQKHPESLPNGTAVDESESIGDLTLKLCLHHLTLVWLFANNS